MLDLVLFAGVALTIVGLVGIFYCIFAVAKAKKAGLEEDDMKARLQQIVVINLGALGVSGLGLMMVIVGLFLG